MLKFIRNVAGCAALLAVLGFMPMAARARADDTPNMQDANTYWQVANSPTPPSPSLDANTYWAEVQAQQQSGPNR